MNRMKQRISNWQPRKLLCFSAAFSFITAVFTLLFSYNLTQYFVYFSLIVAGISLVSGLWIDKKFNSLIFGLLIGIVWCSVFSHMVYNPTQKLIHLGGEFETQILEYPSATNSRVITVKVKSIAGEKLNVKAKLYLHEEIDGLKPGDLLKVKAYFSQADHGLSRNHLQKNIFLTLNLLDDSQPLLISNGADDFFCAAKRLSKEIQGRIQQLIPEESGKLLAAMTSGDSSICSKNFRNALNNTGLAHIAAVSGLHISIFAGFFVTILGKRKGYLIAFPLIISYALITGASPSAVRAVIMQGILMISVFLYREYDAMTSLFVALFLMVMQNPFSIMSTSLLLSFAATYGILLLNGTLMQMFNQLKPKSKLGKRLYWWFASTVSVSLSAMIFTMPITLVVFGQASMLSLISNLLTIWAVSISILGGMFLLLLSVVYMPIAIGFAQIVALPLMYIVWIVQRLGNLTVFVGHTGNLIFEFGAIVALLCMLLVRISKEDQSIGILVSSLVLVMSFMISSVEPLLYHQVRIYGNDGAAIILIRDGNRTVLVGTGDEAKQSCAQVEEGLQKWGRSKISAIICLSDRVKSTGALPAVVQEFEPDNIFVPNGSNVGLLSDESVWLYSNSGTISIPGTTSTIELISITEDIWAMRWIASNVSILMLYGGYSLEISAGVEKFQGDLSADILITDANLLNSEHAATYICSKVSPSMILAADSRFDHLPESVSGVQVISLNLEEPITLTTKR